jgi:hypothetical protein
MTQQDVHTTKDLSNGADFSSRAINHDSGYIQIVIVFDVLKPFDKERNDFVGGEHKRHRDTFVRKWGADDNSVQITVMIRIGHGFARLMGRVNAPIQGTFQQLQQKIIR